MKFTRLLKQALAVGAMTYILLNPAFAASEELKTLNNKGVTALNSKHYEDAILIFNKALKLDPGYDRARSNLAIALLEYHKDNGTNSQKLAGACESLIVDPDYGLAGAALNDLLREAGAEPNDLDKRISLGKRYFQDGRYIPAIVIFRRVLKLKDDPTVQEMLIKAEAAYANDPVENKEMRERILGSEGIYHVRCVTRKPRSINANYNQPVPEFYWVTCFKGPPISTPMTFSVLGESEVSKEADSQRKPSIYKPERDDEYLMFIDNCVPIPGKGFSTYSGAFGRMEANEHNIDLLKKTIASDRILP